MLVVAASVAVTFCHRAGVNLKRLCTTTANVIATCFVTALQLADEQEAIRNSLTAFGEQTSQLESQLVHQASTSGRQCLLL